MSNEADISSCPSVQPGDSRSKEDALTLIHLCTPVSSLNIHSRQLLFLVWSRFSLSVRMSTSLVCGSGLSLLSDSRVMPVSCSHQHTSSDLCIPFISVTLSACLMLLSASIPKASSDIYSTVVRLTPSNVSFFFFTFFSFPCEHHSQSLALLSITLSTSLPLTLKIFPKFGIQTGSLNMCLHSVGTRTCMPMYSITRHQLWSTHAQIYAHQISLGTQCIKHSSYINMLYTVRVHAFSKPSNTVMFKAYA